MQRTTRAMIATIILASAAIPATEASAFVPKGSHGSGNVFSTLDVAGHGLTAATMASEPEPTAAKSATAQPAPAEPAAVTTAAAPAPTAAPEPATRPAARPAPAAAPATTTSAAAAPASGAQPEAATSETLSAAQKRAWFNAFVQRVDPAGKGIWVLDLYGARTSAYNRGNTYPAGYGKARPTVYIYGGGTWNTYRTANTMWHEATHVRQVHDIGYTRSLSLLGGISGMEQTAVCAEVLMGYPRAGWGCASTYRMQQARAIWSGSLR